MREVDPDCPNFLEKKNHKFIELHAVLDNMLRQLRQEGIGAKVRHATLVTAEEERALWEKGVLGTDCPQSLLRAVFYLNGVNRCLRGGSEHRNLKLSQFQRLGNPDRYLYVENGSKNHSGSMSERSIQNKQVPIYSTFETVGERCHVHILDLYISKMPEKAQQNNWFYLRPYSGKASSGAWYFSSPIGERKLQGMVKEMFKEIEVHDKTNHSLQATGTSTLFQNAVPEKIIQERTGHRSVKALRLYERTTARQNEHVSRVLATRSTSSPLTWEKENPSAVGSAQGTSTAPSTSGSFPPFQPHSMPLFGSAQNCTININYGPSGINVSQDYRRFDDVQFPANVEKELACIEF